MESGARAVPGQGPRVAVMHPPPWGAWCPLALVACPGARVGGAGEWRFGATSILFSVVLCTQPGSWHTVGAC